VRSEPPGLRTLIKLMPPIGLVVVGLLAAAAGLGNAWAVVLGGGLVMVLVGIYWGSRVLHDDSPSEE